MDLKANHIDYGQSEAEDIYPFEHWDSGFESNLSHG